MTEEAARIPKWLSDFREDPRRSPLGHFAARAGHQFDDVLLYHSVAVEAVNRFRADPAVNTGELRTAAELAWGSGRDICDLTLAVRTFQDQSTMWRRHGVNDLFRLPRQLRIALDGPSPSQAVSSDLRVFMGERHHVPAWVAPEWLHLFRDSAQLPATTAGSRLVKDVYS